MAFSFLFSILPECFTDSSNSIAPYSCNIFDKICPRGIYHDEWMKGIIVPINPLPDMPILASSNSAANKDIMAKIWTNGDTII